MLLLVAGIGSVSYVNLAKQKTKYTLLCVVPYVLMQMQMSSVNRMKQNPNYILLEH